MTSPREGPNPLRPYYVPPSVSTADDIPRSHGASFNGSRKGPPPGQSLGSSARNILSDIDYSEYISDSTASSPDVIRRLAEQALWKYTSVLFAQPFDVAKTILQVHAPGSVQRSTGRSAITPENLRRRPKAYDRGSYEDNSDESDDSTSYFSSRNPQHQTPTAASRTRRHRRSTPSPDGIPRVHPPQSPPPKPRSLHSLDLTTSSSVLSCLSTVWNAEGAWGVWTGTNSTYVHSILLSTLTSFLRSFLSALFALPDPGLSFMATSPSPAASGGIDILASPSPLNTLFVTVSAAGLAGCILAPLDIVRTKLILTPSTHPPRSILASLRTLPSWVLPWSIAPVTFLHSTLPSLISASSPVILRSKMGIDPMQTPNLYAVGTFLSQVTELAVKLPIETVLRRGQMAVAREGGQERPVPTIVEVGPYKGVLETMRSIIYEEGEIRQPGELIKGTKGAAGMKATKIGQERKRKGQGAEGLWRGWRVGMWGLVGVWGAATLGGIGGKSGEF